MQITIEPLDSEHYEWTIEELDLSGLEETEQAAVDTAMDAVRQYITARNEAYPVAQSVRR